MTDGEPRFRIAAKQTAKNLWQLDATIENKSRTIKIPISNDEFPDMGDIPLGAELVNMITEAEDAFRKDGRHLVSDIE